MVSSPLILVLYTVLLFVPYVIPSPSSSPSEPSQSSAVRTTATVVTNYNVSVVLRDAVLNGSSLISRINGTSPDFNYTFNTAWFPAPSSSLSSVTSTPSLSRSVSLHYSSSSADNSPDTSTVSPMNDGLIVRVVECNANHHSCAGVSHPEWTNAGALAVIRANLSSSVPLSPSPFPTEPVTASTIVWMGTNPPPHGGTTALWGAADPRIAVSPVTGEYYLTWDNCTENCYPHRTTMLSTTKDPFNASAWIFRGPLLGNNAPYTGGAALLLRNEPPHLAFVSNSDTANIINLAITNDPTGYTNWTLNTSTADPWMAGRTGMWDSSGVAPGAQPEKLSTGDYLFIYNIDTGFPYHPSYLGRCSIGWAILDGNEPSRIIARASVPLLTPQLAWETCGGENGKGPWPMCQEPEVVFSTGIKPLGNDHFLLLYGAADSVVGAVEILVTYTTNEK